MNDRLEHLVEKRAGLAARAAAQREQLAAAAAPLRKSLALADRGVAVVRYVAARPLLLAAGSALLAAFGPRLLLKWVPRGWMVWRFLRGLPGKQS